MNSIAAATDLEQTFAGTSEMARRMRALDWAATELGAPDLWPQSLKTAVRIMLTSRYAMWMAWGPKLTFMYNDTYARMTLGAKHPWALGRRSDEVWAEIWPDIGPLIDHVLETGEATWSEGLMLLLERSGYSEETYHTFSYSPLADDSGRLAGMLCVVTEETERIIGERRLATLAHLASRLAAVRTEKEVLDAIGAALGKANKDLPFSSICLFDEGGISEVVRCVGIDSHKDLFNLGDGGFWQEQIAARPTARCTVEIAETMRVGLPTGQWSRPPLQGAIVPIAAQGDAKPVGYLLTALSPHRAYDEAYGSFLELLAGQISAGLASARAYEEERRRADALAEIDRSKTAFFSNVSHEFRTPLALMISPIEEVLAQPADKLNWQSRSLLDVAHRNSTRLLKLVNTLLDFTRIEAGRAQASFEPVDLAAITADLASNFHPAMDKAGLTFVIDCPSLAEPVHVDRDMWEKVVLNLLSNALKFTFEGEVVVKLRPSVDGKTAVLSVCDTGVGVPPQEVSRLFERFHRIEGQRSRSFEGSGIGLALVQELVKQHGGGIEVDSEVGRGTTFTIALPFGSAHLPADRLGGTRSPISTALRVDAYVEEAMRWLPTADGAFLSGTTVQDSGDTTGGSYGKKARILVADDNADMRDYISRLLGARWQVMAVADGAAALAAALNDPPDLVLTDVMMPKLDGFGVVQRLRADTRTRALPILLLSARAGEEARIEGLHAGADDYLIKPFSARELMARVESNLKLAEVRRQGEERISNILESMTDGFHTIDSDWRFSSFNSAAAAMFRAQDVDTGALIGQHVFNEAFADARETPAGRALVLAMTERRPTMTESYYWPWQQWFSVRHYPTPDGGVATFFQDITARIAAEEGLRASEAFKTRILESSSDCITVLRLDGKLEFMSEGGLRTMEVDDFGAIQNCPWPSFWQGAAYDKAIEAIAAACAGEAGRYQGYARTLKGNLRYWDVVVTPIRGADGATDRLLAISRDLTKQRQAEDALRESESTLRAFYDNAPVFMGVVEPTADGDVRHVYDNPLSCAFFGLAPGQTAGRLARAEMNASPVVIAKWHAHYRQAETSGAPVRFEHKIETNGHSRWLSATVATIGPGASGAMRFCYVAEDITERKQAEERQRLLTNELNHRVKNTLAVIQSIASQTLRDTPDPNAFKSAFSARLQALSRAHNLLTVQEWRGADLKDVIGAALGAFKGGNGDARLRIEGPSISIAPNAAVALSLALHELATNAVKYGSLSTSTGTIDLTWTVQNLDQSASTIELCWIERGGPPVDTPMRRGFGRRVIEASADQLGGKIELSYPRQGAECRMILPTGSSSNDPYFSTSTVH